MIHVQGLTRRFGPTTAINDLAFRVGAGEIVGFLGLNGAGKTTTMRILAGSLGPSSGSASIDGHDIQKSPRLAKSKVGYLPERPPVHPEMSVRGYLAHAARLKGAEPKSAVASVMAQTGLEAVAHRLIGNLSKGYQQRVGLAQALVHKPVVLILDEPETGLDPAQRQEIRSLIRGLADDARAILLSTHVLAEVESLCTRVLVIHEGRIVAQDDMSALRTLQVQVARPGQEALGALERVAGDGLVEAMADGRYSLPDDTDREALARVATEFGLLELTHRNRLEERFLRLTRNGA
jgi:ABC-2 type transport system ATP-binding protein